MRKTRINRATIGLLAALGWIVVPAAAAPRLVEFAVDVRQRVDAFSFEHAYEDRSLEGLGITGYEPTGRSELSWASLASTFTEISMGFDLPWGRHLRLRGGHGNFQRGEVQDLDFGASGALWSHSIADASAGGITSGSMTYSMKQGGLGPYWGVSGTRWNLHLDGGRNLKSGIGLRNLEGNSSTYDAQQFNVILGARVERLIGAGRIRLQGEVNSGAGWIHSEAYWNLRNLAYAHDGFSLSSGAHLGMAIAMSEASRVVLDASAGGTYAPGATASRISGADRLLDGGGIRITTSYWALGIKTEFSF